MKKKPDLYDEETLRKIAISYYENKQSQNEIADEFRISRASISSALERARQLGIVKYHVMPEKRPLRLPKIQRDVIKKLGLEYAEVVPAHIDEQGSPTPDVIPDIARAAARYLSDELTNESRLAISGGNVFIRQVVRHIEPKEPLPNMEVFPLSGFNSEQVNVGNASLLAYDLSTLYGAKHSWLPIPAIVESQEECNMVQQLPIVRDVLEKIDKTANLFLLTLFAPYSKEVKSRGILRQEQIDTIMSKHPVSNIEMSFYREDGECVNTMLAEPPFYLTGYDINKLKTKVASNEAEVVLVAGANKNHVKAIRSVLNAGLVNVLITDHITAMRLISDSA